MNRKLFNVILFAVGAATGAAVTWKVVKTKYELIAQEEIDSVKKEYSHLMQTMKKKLQDSVDCEDDDEDEPVVESDDNNIEDDYDEDEDLDRVTTADKIEYHRISSVYRSPSENDDTAEEGGKGDLAEAPYINGPYVISPDDFRNSPPGYNAQSLDYYMDGILADGWGVKMDIEETIGQDSLDHFGEYADDILYVRNERMEIDYEVARDPRTYAEAVQLSPNPYYGR